MNTTTRRYPRSMREAFKDCEYACAIERPESRGEKVAGVALAILIGILLAGWLVKWWAS